MKLPTWLYCHQKKETGKDLSAVERFIHDNEPATDSINGAKADQVFREQLSNMLDEVCAQVRPKEAK
jgi:hypothetical protein